MSSRNSASSAPEGSPHEQLPRLSNTLLRASQKFAMPLALVAGFNSTITTALAAPHHATARPAQAEKTATYASEVAQYFAAHQEEIRMSITEHVHDPEQRALLEKTVSLIAQNTAEQHFLLRVNPALPADVGAQFHGAKRTVEIHPGFSITNLADQAQLIHEVVHVVQDAQLRTAAQTDAHHAAAYERFWKHSTTHPGESFAIAEFEKEGITAFLEYLNARTDNKLRLAAQRAKNSKEYTRAVQAIFEEYGINIDADGLQTAANRAFLYFSPTRTDKWNHYVDFVYGCFLDAALYSPQLSYIGHRSSEECDDLAKDAGVKMAKK